MSNLFAYGLGLGTRSRAGKWLEVFFPRPRLAPPAALVPALERVLGDGATLDVMPGQLPALAAALEHAGLAEEADLAFRMKSTDRAIVAVLLATDAPPATTPEAYLKLHLLSHRLVPPHGTDLTGLFGILPNVAWTSAGPVALEDLPDRQLESRLAGGFLAVHAVDKFPPMADYVVPPGVRIADAQRVRLGAHLATGTTVMHEGFVNFNAGTLGQAMVEGRISAGVTLGDGSDLGGGASTMGTLSGGGKTVITLGKGCLVGANAGVGIPLGDRCTVEAGLYLTAGTVVTVLDAAGATQRTVKARELAGVPDLLFRRHSQNGRVECLPNPRAIALNAALHAQA